MLAGELAAADGDPHVAFAGYESVLRDYVDQNQQLALQAAELRRPPSAEAMAQAAGAVTLKPYAR